AAIQEANALAGHVDVNLGDHVTYLLTRVGAGENAAATGDLDVTSHISIAGHGSTIDAGGIDRAFQVLSGGQLDLNAVTIEHGLAPVGGGLRVDLGGTANVTNSTISNNEANGETWCDQLVGASSLACTTETTSTTLSPAGEGG